MIPTRLRRRTVLFTLSTALALALSGAAPAAAAEPDGDPLVLTGTQATYSLAMAITAGTPVQVRNVPEDGRQLSLLKDYIERRLDTLGATFKAATAVVTLTNALPVDPLYRFARNANIRIIDIDAAQPWQLDMPGVALTELPRSDVDWSTTEGAMPATAPCLWLSIPNAIRMADIIAHDLGDLFPDSAPAFNRNLQGLRRSLLELRNEFLQRPAPGGDAVFALTGDFVYLTNDLGLFVDGYFIKQDVNWSEKDLSALTRHLRERGIRVVLHRWQPSEPIQKAISAAGARLVVLDPGDTGLVVDDRLAPDGLQRILGTNLQLLQAALDAPATRTSP